MSTQTQRVSFASEAAYAEDASPSRDQAESVSTETSSPLESAIADTINALAAGGVAMQDMGPLLHLKHAVRYIGAEENADAFTSKRRNHPASDALMARAAVIMDLLVQGGWTQEQAAQTTARQLIGSGVTLPEVGGDARGWKRLVYWRTRLKENLQSSEAQVEYESFTEEVTDIPAEERLARALNDRLWDRRSGTPR